MSGPTWWPLDPSRSLSLKSLSPESFTHSFPQAQCVTKFSRNPSNIMRSSTGIVHVCGYLRRYLPPTENRSHFVFLPLCLAHSIRHLSHMFWKSLRVCFPLPRTRNTESCCLFGLTTGSASIFRSFEVQGQGPQELYHISHPDTVHLLVLSLS